VVDESPTKDTKEPPAAAADNDNDEVEKKEESDEGATEKDAKEEKEDGKQEETSVKVEEKEQGEPKTREDIRNAFDPFFDSNSTAKDTDKIAKESADATKELASIFS
jgi:hypothetical protein